MPALQLAFHTQRGLPPLRDVVVGTPAPAPGPLAAPARIALACRCADPQAFAVRAQPVLRAESDPEAVLSALAPEACLVLYIEPDTLTVRTRHAAPRAHGRAPLQYIRLADATVKPLPAEHPAPVSAHGDAPPVRAHGGAPLLPGDAYLALTPGALAVADSPALARFIHQRDYFNAEKMAAALRDHLLELAVAQAPHAAPPLPEDITVLVLECR